MKMRIFCFFLLTLFFVANLVSCKKDKKTASGVDLDLTSLNKNMLYAEVFNMLVEPETYEGKVLKVRGNFQIYNDSGVDYYAVVIYDATACCQEGVEFQYDFGGAVPEPGSEITVTGKYTMSYLEDDILYAYLTADSVEING